MPSKWSETLTRKSSDLCTRSGELARCSDELLRQAKFLIEELRQDKRRRHMDEPKTEPYFDHAAAQSAARILPGVWAASYVLPHPLQIKLFGILA